MTTLLEWVPAPDGQVLVPGACLARDADGQGCAYGLVRLVPHQSTGLRAWLESGGSRRSSAPTRRLRGGRAARLSA
jgi:hypothetical protein